MRNVGLNQMSTRYSNNTYLSETYIGNNCQISCFLPGRQEICRNTISFSLKEKNSLYSIFNHLSNNFSLSDHNTLDNFLKSIPVEIINTLNDAFPQSGKRKGILLIKNLPHLNPNLFLLAFSRLLGTPIQYREEGDLIMNISPKEECSAQLPSFQNTKEMQLHTDLSYIDNPPDLILIICIHSGMPKTTNFFCNIDDALPMLTKAELEELEKEQFIFQHPPHVSQLSKNIGSKPRAIINVTNNGTYIVRYRGDICHSLSEAGQRASAALSSAMGIQAHEFYLEDYSLAILDNQSMVHGRSKIPEPNNSMPNRLLRRIYVNQSPKKHDVQA